MSQQGETARPATSRRAVGIIGGLAFAVGFILALIGGIIARDNAGVVLVLVILGVAVSLLNITAKEVVPVMLAAVALIVGAGIGAFTPLDNIFDGFGKSLNGIVNYLAVFMVPVGVISAVRAVMAMARPVD